MARGGDRSHPKDCRCGKCPKVGRRANPTKDVHLAQKEAEKLLAALEKRKSLEEIYGNCGDHRIQTMINLKVREWAGQGIAAERQEISGPGGGPVPVKIVSHIPRPKK